MTINSIVRVDENHIKIMATPDSASDVITAVRVDDQLTFVCQNDPSEVAFSLSIPEGETSFINVPLSLEDTPFLIDSDLLFFFITSKKVVDNADVYSQSLAIYYNEEALYKLVYKVLEGLLYKESCCNLDLSIEGRMVIILKAFELAIEAKQYRSAIKFWMEIHENNPTLNSACHCNG